MEVLGASVIAVLGTLLGTTVAHHYQRKSTRLAAGIERAERLRQERLDAYAAYGGALMDYRRGVMDRWYAEREEHPDDDRLGLRRTSYALRTAAQEAMFRVELLTDSRPLVDRAREALTEVEQLYATDDRAVFARRRESSKAAIYAFVTASKAALDPAGPAAGRGRSGNGGG
ncbi:hypothetical protein [Streptomyces aidingensis]|uniref:Protein kilB n=1 Tax=Streptomyces aidingensis TaxID=910347 RepID=A0A1I1MVA8_9ACTN|nr:hypothetical protein [Streptomyces aidingensis]SFC89384.1 hypothetical protein SAMN05421773_10789 [Streptomyces aidingensis]